MPNVRQWGVASVAMWVVAGLASIPFYGLLGLLNLPRWLLHVIEALEYVAFVLAGNDPLAVLGALGQSSEAALVVVGLPVLAAWAAGIGCAFALARDDEWRRFAVVVVFAVLAISPITSAGAAYWAALEKTGASH